LSAPVRPCPHCCSPEPVRRGLGPVGSQLPGAVQGRGGSAMFGPLAGRLRWLGGFGKCAGRAPGHMVGACFWGTVSKGEWLFCWLWCGVGMFEKA
jgi:hypothetical protein